MGGVLLLLLLQLEERKADPSRTRVERYRTIVPPFLITEAALLLLFNCRSCLLATTAIMVTGQSFTAIDKTGKTWWAMMDDDARTARTSERWNF